jgi:hypothetical protein
MPGESSTEINRRPSTEQGGEYELGLVEAELPPTVVINDNWAEPEEVNVVDKT